MSLISVIVPVYNVEQYLHRCIDSILSQTFTDFELILVDDGSSDKSGTICDEYAKKDKRITVIHNPNSGVSVTRNTGLDWAFEKSDSKWIAFIDSDDMVHSQYLEILYKAVCKHDAKVSACGFVRTDVQTDSFKKIDPEISLIDTKNFYVKDNTNFVVIWGKLYAKECFDNIRYPVGKIHEDEFITYKILFEYESISFVKEKLYYYFTNANGIMNSKFSMKRYDAIQAFEEKIEYFERRGWYDFRDDTINSITMHLSLYSIKARKEHIYMDVPSKYRVGFIKALKNLYNILGRDKYEYMVGQYYPLLIKLQAYYFKIKSLFTKNNSNNK